MRIMPGVTRFQARTRGSKNSKRHLRTQCLRIGGQKIMDPAMPIAQEIRWSKRDWNARNRTGNTKS